VDHVIAKHDHAHIAMLIASGPAPPSDPAAAVAATAMIARRPRTRCFAISFFAFPSIACRIERAGRSGGFPARRHAPIRRRPDRESEPLLPKTNTFSRKKRKPYLRRIAARNNEIRQIYWPSPAIPRLYRIVERRIYFRAPARKKKPAGLLVRPAVF